MVVFGEAAHVGHQKHGLRAVEPTAQIPGDVHHPLQFCNRVTPVGVVGTAEIEGVVTGKQFGGMHHQPDALFRR